jgi:hypothetical protein
MTMDLREEEENAVHTIRRNSQADSFETAEANPQSLKQLEPRI